MDEAAKRTAEELCRPCLYLNSYRTRKEALIEKIIEEDGIEEGLVAVLRVIEGAQSFRVASGKGGPRNANASRKCLCVYYCFLDPRFGLVHDRIQTWLPFTVQVCVNSHEYLRHRHRFHRPEIPWTPVPKSASARHAQLRSQGRDGLPGTEA